MCDFVSGYVESFKSVQESQVLDSGDAVFGQVELYQGAREGAQAVDAFNGVVAQIEQLEVWNEMQVLDATNRLTLGQVKIQLGQL